MQRVLVIGGGSIGERHVRCFQHTERAVVSLCEINDTVRDRVTQRYGLPSSFSEFDTAVAEHWDAAVICTPAHLHVEMALELAQRGVHLLIEKPLSTRLDDARQLAETLDSLAVKSSVAYVYRANPALWAMKQALDSRRFGKPVQVSAISGQHFPFYRPAYRETYYTRHETGGGAIQDALTHLVNAVEWLVGPVTKVTADKEHFILEGVEVEDTVHAITRHGRVMGSFSFNQHQPPNETLLTVICERGAARLESHRGRWLSAVEHGADWVEEETFALERDDMFVRQANAFLDCIEKDAAPACTVAEALQTLRVNLAMLDASASSTWIDLR